MNNNTNKVAMGLVMGLTLTCASSVLANNEFDYASVTGADINFTGGGNFDFTPSPSFQITDSSLGTSANGFTGSMAGTWTMGTINNISPGIQEAAITGSGTFTIVGGGGTLTGTLVWDDIEQIGTGSTANYLASVNLTAMTYTGTNPELVTLAGQTSVIDTLNFTFVPAESLTALAAGGLSTSFSGSINGTTPPGAMAPDGGMTVALLGGAMVALAGLRRKLGC
jgi:hypothetical protein